MNSSVFGKKTENIINTVNIKLVSTKEKAEKLVAKPNFYNITRIDEDTCIIQMKTTNLCFSKPIPAGICISDFTKTLMYDFHYNYIKKKYGEKAKLLFKDKDSLMYEIETEDFYKELVMM